MDELPGDEVIAGAGVVLDRSATFDASAEELWPWLVQLGKNRAGWYLTRRWSVSCPGGGGPADQRAPFQALAGRYS